MKSTNILKTNPKPSLGLRASSNLDKELLSTKLAAMGLLPESEPPPGFNPKDVAPRSTGDEVQPILTISLDVSGRCNLACKYCAEAVTQPKRETMTTNIVETAVKLLDLDASHGFRPSVRIGSGEPLLAIPLLQHLHRILTDSNEMIDVFLTTNGTLIDENVADWLMSTGWRIKISLDGPQSIHDDWRRDHYNKPTYSRVVRAVQLMVERCPDRTSVAAVLCRGANPAKVFEAIASLGVNRIELLPVAYRSILDSDKITPTADDVAAYVRFISDYARSIIVNGPEAHPTLVRFEECVRHAMGYGNSVVPCGAGRSFVAIGPDGHLYPCFRFVGIEEYIIGDVKRGFDLDASTAFRTGAGRITHNRPQCSSCWGSPLCCGQCFSVTEFFGAGEGKPNEIHCAYKLADARTAIWMVNELQNNDMEKLLPFLPLGIDLP